MFFNGYIYNSLGERNTTSPRVILRIIIIIIISYDVELSDDEIENGVSSLVCP